MTRWKIWTMVLGLGTVGGLAFAQQPQPTENAPTPPKMEAQPPKSMDTGGAMSLSDAPPAVQKTLKREAQGNQIQDLKQTKDLQGNTVFQAEIVKGEKGVQIQVAPDGTLVKKGTPHSEKGEAPAE